MKNIIFLILLLSFICCINKSEEYVLLCYSMRKNIPHSNEIIAEYCDTIINGKRFYSEKSDKFYILNKIDSTIKYSELQINDTLFVNDKNKAIVQNTLIIDERIYYRCIVWSGNVTFYSAHNKDFGTLLAKFDYRTYLKLNTAEKRNAEQISIEKDFNTAIELLKGYGGWDF